ncbi:MAG: substrate-binding domain-containing protein [Propionibacteriaceae bacterium]|jgi:DNA-binding LacI/PurR family transcriptional regulator|nr:substrate-binding domain-containing protein [Propionibacteriaceae bacterium]
MSDQEESAFSWERRESILAELGANGSVRVTQLSKQFKVSPITIRRDIDALARRGLLLRVYGGAILRGPVEKALTNPATKPVADRHTIGMVVPNMDYYWPQIARGAQSVVEHSQSRLLLRGSSYSIKENRAQIARLIEDDLVEGLILAPDLSGQAGFTLMKWLEKQGVPVMLVERHLPRSLTVSPFESVATDQRHAARLGVEHLVSRCHKKIGFLITSASPHGEQLRQGWLEACQDLGLSTEGVPTADAVGFNVPGHEKVLDEIIEQCQSSGTTAVMVHADREAIALMQRVRDLGLRVPQDLAILSYDDEFASLADPPLSSVRPPKQLVGVRAAQLLLNRLDDSTRPIHRLSLCSELVIRQTCGPHEE